MFKKLAAVLIGAAVVYAFVQPPTKQRRNHLTGARMRKPVTCKPQFPPGFRSLENWTSSIRH
jgi:hypothetical protein